MTSPEPQQPTTPEKEEGQWVPPPLEPLEVAFVASIFLLPGLILFATKFYPVPREASRNVHDSLFMLSIIAPSLALNWRKLRSNLSGAVSFGTVLYPLLSVWLGIVEPHLLIPWFLHPMAVFMAASIVAVVGLIWRARNGLSARA